MTSGRWPPGGGATGSAVFSDECYADFTWADAPRSILETGLDGVVAVHSLSKRSNLAGVRAGFYAGDPSSSASCAWCASTRAHDPRSRPGRCGGRLRRRRTRRAASASATSSASSSWSAGLRAARLRRRAARGHLLPLDPCARAPRRRLGDGRGAGPRQPDCWSARATSTDRPGARFVRLAVVQPTERLEPWRSGRLERTLRSPGAARSPPLRLGDGRPPRTDLRLYADASVHRSGRRGGRSPWSPRPSACSTGARSGWPSSTRRAERSSSTSGSSRPSCCSSASGPSRPSRSAPSSSPTSCP